MAKRLTDTSKWDRASFRKLSPKLKCAWQFLCDRCDHGGIWEIDLEAMGFFIGEEFSLAEILESFNVEQIGEDKLFIPDFIEFQYGSLNPSNRVHQSVIQRAESLKIKGLKRSLQGAMDKDIEKDKEKEEEAKVRRPPAFDFPAIYQSYPLKKGKSRGLHLCKAQIKTQADYESFAKAVASYRGLVEREKTEPKYIKHFDTFMNCWRDYLDHDVGTALVVTNNQSTTCRLVKE